MYSNRYIQQLQSLHLDPKRPQGFGGKVKDLGKFYKYVDTWNPKSVLDYGCGKGHILSHLKDKYPTIKFTGYDPALPMFSTQPKDSYDCIFSNDVLEHIEPEFINQVLEHIDTLASKYIWLRIDTVPARKILSDGRNAHLILESQQWWNDKLTNIVSGQIVYNNLDKRGKLDVAIEK
jgi:2-polyprenyl-3-methyl-5-hydroxy-6-metoxy-1,4-benzoquinol methylase